MIKTTKLLSNIGAVSGAAIEPILDDLIRELTLDEQIEMLSGRGFYAQFLESERRWGAHAYRAGAGCERLDIPSLLFTDGPRGVARGNSTCFPCTMARGATFDPELEHQVGQVMAIEARAQGCNFSGAVCVNLLRHPAWGRAQETYGEDPEHLGEMGVALASGLQAHNVIATVKHFAVNSIENARFKVNVVVTERVLREVFLPQFKKIIDAGCLSVMTSYNKLNGEYCGQNSWLLTKLLREEWGFQGFVHSDWGLGVYIPEAVEAGLDIENPEPKVFGRHLKRAVVEGRVRKESVERSCRRILRALIYTLSQPDPLEKYSASLVASESHCRLAREVAEKSITLLKNEQCLPLNKFKLRRLAVIGSLASKANIGDNGSSRVRPPYVISPLIGITNHLGNDVEVRTADESDIETAKEVCRWADAVIVVAGYTADEEGEYIPGDISLGVLGEMVSDESKDDLAEKKLQSRGGDRVDLTLGLRQEELIKAAASVNTNVVVTIVAGSAVVMESWRESVPAILYNYYSGMEGGNALADVIFGNVNPSGKLPFTIPKHSGQLPFFDRDADEINYELYAGYTYADHHKYESAYSFGHGLSYSSFSYANQRVDVYGDDIVVSVDVSNIGDFDGDEVAQLYVFLNGKVIERQRKLLKAFKRVPLRAGETKRVELRTSRQALCFWSEEIGEWLTEENHTVVVAGSSQHAETIVDSEGIELSLGDNLTNVPV